MNLLKFFKKRIILLVFLILLLCGIIAALVVGGGMMAYDADLESTVTFLQNKTATNIFLIITALGKNYVVMALALLVTLVLWLKKMSWQVLGLWVSIIGSVGVTYLIKHIINRPRPLGALVSENSASFPSGHATLAVAFYGFLMYLLLKSVKNTAARIFILLGNLVLIALIGFSRLYLGVHYPSDILAGYLIGTCGLIVGTMVVEWKTLR